MEDWWQFALQGAAGSVAMVLIMGWLARSRLRASKPARRRSTLTYPNALYVVGLIGLVFFGAAGYFAWRSGEGAVVLAIFASFVALNLYLLAECVTVRHELLAEGLRYRTFLGRRGILKWQDLVLVRFAPTMRWFRLVSRDGRVVRVSAMLQGLPDFAAALLANVDHSRIDQDTLGVLQATAGGSPPSIWH